VRFDGWGGVVSEAFRKYAFDPYTEKTGVPGRRRHVRRRRRVSRAVKASQPGEYNIAHLSGVFDYARYASLRPHQRAERGQHSEHGEYVMPALVDVFRRHARQA
jgi:spermidine/putrescine transport system substrate-binding protein